MSGGTKVVQVPRAPSVEGLPLHMPSNLQVSKPVLFHIPPLLFALLLLLLLLFILCLIITRSSLNAGDSKGCV